MSNLKPAAASFPKPGPTARASAADFKSHEKFDTLADAMAITDAAGADVVFVGFDPKKFREEMRVKGVNAPAVTKILTAYAVVGNNPENLIDPRRAKPRDDLKLLIMKTGERMARFAIAYMPMLLLIRMRLSESGKLQNRFENVPNKVEMQDPAFAGWLGDELLQFMELFDAALSKTGNLNQHGLGQVKRWMNIARSGFDADVDVKRLMVPRGKNQDEIFSWFQGCFA